MSSAKRARPVENAAAMIRSGLRPGEQLHQAGVLVADERVGGQPDVVDEHLELLLRG